MTTQPEQVLENKLIKQLVGLGYEQVKVTDDQEPKAGDQKLGQASLLESALLVINANYSH